MANDQASNLTLRKDFFVCKQRIPSASLRGSKMFMNYLFAIGRSQVATSDLHMLTEQVNSSQWSFQNIIKQWEVVLLWFNPGRQLSPT